MALPALGVAVVAYSDNVLTARAFGARRSQTVDANAELVALGMANLAVGVLRGFPVSSSGSRTAIGDAQGSRTPLHSLVAVVLVVVVLVAGNAVLAEGSRPPCQQVQVRCRDRAGPFCIRVFGSCAAGVEVGMLVVGRPHRERGRRLAAAAKIRRLARRR